MLKSQRIEAMKIAEQEHSKILERLKVVEGYRNTKEVVLLAKRMDVEMPIVDQIYHSNEIRTTDWISIP